MKKTFLIILFFILISILIFFNSVRAQGLVGYWSFDDCTAKDSSGKNNNGVIVGAVCSPGKIGNALRFDGINDYVNATTSGILSSKGTVELWANTSSIPSSTKNYMFNHAVGSYSSRIYLFIMNGYFHIGLGGSNDIATGGSVSRNRWYHYALTWNGTHYSFYLNGTLQGSGTYTGLTGIETFLCIGANCKDIPGGFLFNGTIDEVNVYDYALTAGEIYSHYQGETKYRVYGRMVNKTGSPVNATVSVGSTSNDTDSNGNYSVSIAPGTYDIQYYLNRFVISNFYIKLPSLTINSNLKDLVSSVTQYSPKSGKYNISFSYDETKSKIVQTYSSSRPNKIIIDGNVATEVSSLSQLKGYNWFYNSTENMLYINTTPVQQASQCGNSACESGETQSNCCNDCGCPTGQSCNTTSRSCYTPPSTCTSCGNWINGTCGGGSCPSTQKQQTRSCTPAGCTPADGLGLSRCVADSSCGQTMGTIWSAHLYVPKCPTTGCNQITYASTFLDNKTLKAAKEMGITHIHIWQYNFDAEARTISRDQIVDVVRRMKEYGLQPIIDLEYNVNEAVALVTELGSDCMMYEVGKEPHISGSGGSATVDEYVNYFNQIVSACRQVNPDAMYGGPTVGSPTTSTESRSGVYVNAYLQRCDGDFLSVHSYPGGSTQPEAISRVRSNTISDVQQLKSKMTNYGKNLPIVISEISWTSAQVCTGYACTDSACWDCDQDFNDQWNSALMSTAEEQNISTIVFWVLIGYDNNFAILRQPAQNYFRKPQFYSIQGYINGTL